MYRELMTISSDRHRPHLASILDNSASICGQRREADALAATKETASIAPTALVSSAISVFGTAASAARQSGGTGQNIGRHLSRARGHQPDQPSAKLTLGLFNLAKALEGIRQKQRQKDAAPKPNSFSELQRGLPGQERA